MEKVQWTEGELQSINLHGETCGAVARAAMQRSGISFDDIEQINDHYETHRWGSDADRRYRKAAVNKAVRRVAANPLLYAAPRQEEAAAILETADGIISDEWCIQCALDRLTAETEGKE